MKKLLSFQNFLQVITVVALFATTGCGKHEQDVLYICMNTGENHCGILVNASKYSDLSVVTLTLLHSDFRDFEIAHGARTDGGITIMLPETLETTYLQEFNINGRRIMPPTVTVSNPEVKMLTVSWFYGVDIDGYAFVNLWPRVIDENDIGKNVFHYAASARFVYVDSDLTISGYSESMFDVIPAEGYKGPHQWTQKTTYSIDCKKGWNVWWTSSTWHEPTAHITAEYSTTPIGKLYWNVIESDRRKIR